MWWITLLLLIGLLVAVVIVRTLLFNPQKQTPTAVEEINFDREKAVESLKELVRCKTVSYKDHSLEDNGEFEKLIALLPQLYPNVFSTCSFTKLPDRALLFKWQGREEGDASVLMAHYDVVPVDESGWDKPAFDGVIENGVMYGRGTLDTKVTFNAILSAADKLISDGYTPKNDIYFAFSGGEEVNGDGAKHIVDYFENEGISLKMVLDEGGAVVENVFPGVTKPCGMIGIAEKGMMNVRYTAKSNGGHASSPKPKTPVDTLAKACVNVVKNPFKSHLTAPVAKMFDTLGRNSNFVYKMIFANLWLFYPVLDMICKKSGGELNALMRTTTAFTQMNGSSAANVIPPKAEMVSNMRLNPKDTIDSALLYLNKTVNDQSVTVELIEGMNPSRISVTDCEGYSAVKEAVEETWQGCITSPYLMVQCSDSRHYGRISDKVYRFSAMDLTSEERASIHGNNEHIRLQTIHSSVEFYIRLIKKC